MTDRDRVLHLNPVGMTLKAFSRGATVTPAKVSVNLIDTDLEYEDIYIFDKNVLVCWRPYEDIQVLVCSVTSETFYIAGAL